jgi:hypothetical protein
MSTISPVKDFAWQEPCDLASEWWTRPALTGCPP